MDVKYNLKKSSTIKVGEHISSSFSMSIISFTYIENKHDVCGVKYCMKKFCECLKKKEMKLLTKDQQKLYKNVNICSVCRENF